MFSYENLDNAAAAFNKLINRIAVLKPEGEVEEAVLAEYREKDGVYCICVATRPDAEGYADTYWISVDSGLLYRAERVCGEDLVYRFSASEPEAEPPEADRFLLPDGSRLEP